MSSKRYLFLGSLLAWLALFATVNLESRHFKKKKQLLFFEMLDALCELLLLDKEFASVDADMTETPWSY
jgi:hypothetical protein